MKAQAISNETLNGSQFHDSDLTFRIIYRIHHYLSWLLHHLFVAVCEFRWLVYLISQMFRRHLLIKIKSS